MSSVDSSRSHLNSARFDRRSFRRSASASSVMSSTTATSVFNQTDDGVDLSRAIETQKQTRRGWKMLALRLFNAGLIERAGSAGA